MRITNWAILYSFLFLAFLVPLDLQISMIQKTMQVEWMYEKLIDRAMEDCLSDTMTMEYGDGQFVVDKEEILNGFLEQLYFDFSLVTREDQIRLRECIPVLVLMEADGYYICDMKREEPLFGEKILYEIITGKGTRLPMEEVRDYLEQQAAKRNENWKLSFPYISHEEWSQSLEKTQLIAYFSGLPTGVDGKTYERFFLSGARIEKRSAD